MSEGRRENISWAAAAFGGWAEAFLFFFPFSSVCFFSGNRKRGRRASPDPPGRKLRLTSFRPGRKKGEQRIGRGKGFPPIPLPWLAFTQKGTGLGGGGKGNWRRRETKLRKKGKENCEGGTFPPFIPQFFLPRGYAGISPTETPPFFFFFYKLHSLRHIFHISPPFFGKVSDFLIENASI